MIIGNNFYTTLTNKLFMAQSQFFTRPIPALPVSEHFKKAMEKHDIHTLEEIMDLPIAELVNLKWFTKEILEELEDLLF